MRRFFFLVICFFLQENISAIQPKNLQLLGTLSFPGQSLSGCWHYNHADGKEYALIGASNGIAIVDITIPDSLVLILQLPGVTSNWHEIKVLGDYAYAVCQGGDTNNVLNGMQIIDLRFLPDSVPFKFYTGDGAIANKLTTAHSITADGHYVYINGNDVDTLGGGVLIADVSDPWNPVFVGGITTRYCHDSYVRGNIIFTSDIHQGMFSVYDISDRSNPVILATQTTVGQFNHNTWLNDDGTVLFTTDERPSKPLCAYDVADFNNISLLDTFYNGNMSSSEVHNVRVLNDFLINPSYGSQLTLADASRPSNIIEIGNYPTGNSLCWDADPYTNSGNIIATDKSGMYLFAPTYQRACYLEGSVTDSATGASIINAGVRIISAEVKTVTNVFGDYQTGYADAGSYTVEYSKNGYLTKRLTVSLQNGILTTLNVKLAPPDTLYQQNDFSIFPNPTVENINIASGDEAVTNWKIIDECGRLVMQSPDNFHFSQKLSLNISSLSVGAYTLLIGTTNNQIKKLFIKHNP